MIQYEKGRVLVTAHRGISGGNIPCNTKEAFQIALLEGADILELDVARSADGELFVFHPGMEKPHLGIDCYLKDLTAKEIKELRYQNQDDVKTDYGVVPLEEMFLFLKDKAYINVDKYWTHMEEIAHCIRRCGVEEQVIVKIKEKAEQAEELAKVSPDFAVMPVLRNHPDFAEALVERGVHCIGAEVLFETDTAPIVSEAYIQRMHQKGLMLYGNAIVYDCRENISAGHTDDVALGGNPQKGWGWFAERGFDIIQTDWCLLLKQYLKSMKG